MRRIGLCLLTAVFAFASSIAAAQFFEDGRMFHSKNALDNYRLSRALNNCAGDHFYARQQEDVPVSVAATLAQPEKANLIFRTCVDGAKNTHYFVRQQMTAAVDHSGTIVTRPPSSSVLATFLARINGEARPLPSGLCRAFEYEVFLGNKSSTDWGEVPPQNWTVVGYVPRHTEYAMVTNSGCPPTSDPGYFRVSNVPNGLLKSFIESWQKVTASPAAFDKALPLSAISFRTIALDRHATFSVIECDPVAGYCTAHLGNYVIGFDATDKGVMPTDISYQHAGLIP